MSVASAGRKEDAIDTFGVETLVILSGAPVFLALWPRSSEGCKAHSRESERRT